MAFTDRFNTRTLVVGAGLCAAGIALCSAVAAAPLASAECAPGALTGKECVAPAAAFAPMAGIPMALPGPVPVIPAAPPLPVVPAAPPVPLIPAAPVVPVVPAAGAPVAAGASAVAGAYAGKGDPVGPLPAGAPMPGQPLPAGPSPAR
jgi:hypothetical protein